jgi:glyceraldehyde-3-phosphate dehydrogenase (NADP+)
MKKQCERLIRGNPLSPSTEISNLIDEQNAMRIERWVNEAITLGAELICGGKREGSFYEPTLLTQTHNKMKVYAEEVFGPVSCIEKFSTIEEAVNKVNDSRFGLQCGLFSDSNSEIEYCMNNLEVGGIILNDAPTLRLDHMPYGGVKDSGLGREGVKYAIQEFMEPRILVK